ncbi:MAG: TIGR02647 family protein [Pontibacterium sp.]
MRYTKELLFELNVLNQFSLESSQHGIKVHKSADEELIEATRRLFEKGLITQVDGGYLTPLGRDAREASASLLLILTTENRQPI